RATPKQPEQESENSREEVEVSAQTSQESTTETSELPSEDADVFEQELPFPAAAHFHIRKSRDMTSGHISVDTSATVMQATAMNPWFIDPDKDEIILDRSTTGLQGRLEEEGLTNFADLLDPARVSGKTPHSTDKIQLALVALTGDKTFSPEFAGWGSTVPRDGGSVSKLLSLYALYQL